jgi:subtilase family serine protease
MRGVTRSTVLLVGLPLLGLGVAGTEVVPASGSPIAASVAAASTTRAATKSTTYYAMNQRICKTPKKTGMAACFAERRVLVKPGTKGARSFTPAAGATGTDTIGPAGGLTPSDLATAYALTTTGGSGQTVAIVDAYNNPNIAVDLATFDSQYGLAACPLGTCLKVVNQTGGTALPANDTQGWSVEESLDVDAVHSVCQACKIILVEANSPSNADLAIAENTAVQLGATEVSNSFGGFESDSDPTFQAAFDHPGTVITAAAGDDGYYSFDQLAAINQPDIPASYNTVVAVGGTSLYLGQNATRQAETAWNSNGTEDFYEQVLFGLPLGAGGGGCSTVFAARHWQTNLSGWASTACGTKRLVADIAAVGDSLTGFDVYDSYDCGASCGGGAPGWITVGGTSLSTPIIAATYALAGGAHGMPYPALTLYGHRGYAYDVTVGGNGWCGGEGAAGCGNPNSLGYGVVDCDYPATGTTPSVGDRACDALAGYDGPTGLGTPNGLTAFTKTGPTATLAGPTSVTHGTSNTWTATTTDPFPLGAVTSFTWNWGDGTAATVTSTGSASHTYATGGVTRTITLTVKDGYGITGTAMRSVTVS